MQAVAKTDTEFHTAPGKGKIDIDKLTQLIKKHPNATNKELALMLGNVTSVGVWKARNKLDVEPEIDTEFGNKRADIFRHKMRLIIDERLTVDRIKNMHDKDAALWFNSLYNNERLERGQSTENTSMIVKVLDALKSSETIGIEK